LVGTWGATGFRHRFAVLLLPKVRFVSAAYPVRLASVRVADIQKCLPRLPD